MTESNVVEDQPSELTWISYEDFGRRFFVEAVTTDRIAAAVAGMAGKGMKIGPSKIGPGGIAGIVAEGTIGKPTISRRDGDDVRFDLMVPASLVLSLRFGQQVRIEASVEINLELSARAAAPLLIVIDIPKVTHDDVKLVVRAEALGAAWEWLLEPIGRIVRFEVANRLNAMLSDPASVRGRVFDIGARIDDNGEQRSTNTTFDWITYEEFGTRFFQHAVTQARISEGAKDLAGRKIEIGPLKTGPGDMASVSADGAVRAPRTDPRSDNPVEFDLTVPLDLDLVISIARDNNYKADIAIPLVLTARAAEPLQIVVDVAQVDPDDVDVELKSKGLSASVLGLIGGVKKQIREQVAAEVNNQTRDRSSRTVDVAARIASA
ncbi:hypothetical protein [Antrihabitans cavernicola]|uniref:Uncharacterized protein n=1 Tax=Antrihabitans cavernicola TaxID=2495913 RepID=A0A5A7SDH0_9NOCA|nr:hypothetical protein [Spelaeibacter cavernicola]KAA0022623.1 hypothetical protein FOY51_13120 [Spelaeibacter cavernicola]